MLTRLTLDQRLRIAGALAPLLRDEKPRNVKLVDSTGAVVGSKSIQVGRAVLAKAAVAFGTVPLGCCVDCRGSIKKSATRCRSCYVRTRRLPPVLCVECGATLRSSSRAKYRHLGRQPRCRPCATRIRSEKATVWLCSRCGSPRKTFRRGQWCGPCFKINIQASRKNFPKPCPDCDGVMSFKAVRCRKCAYADYSRRMKGKLKLPRPICLDCGTCLGKSARSGGTRRCRKCFLHISKTQGREATRT